MSDYSVEDHIAYKMGFKAGQETQAARIAELEAALRQIEADCNADYPPSTGAIKYAARAALARGKDE